MNKSVYLETSIPSYLTARSSSDIRAMAWQQITLQWWEEERKHYEIFISELVIIEASAGDREAAKRRLKSLKKLDILAQKFVLPSNFYQEVKRYV